jgi:tetratricopeptide (TPR) repeat protein
LAFSLHRNGKFAEAAKLCRKVIKKIRAKRTRYLLYVAAGALLKQGKFTDALATFDNAHITASDAPWTGLPVLTQLGETFSGRLAAFLQPVFPN